MFRQRRKAEEDKDFERVEVESTGGGKVAGGVKSLFFTLFSKTVSFWITHPLSVRYIYTRHCLTHS